MVGSLLSGGEGRGRLFPDLLAATIFWHYFRRVETFKGVVTFVNLRLSIYCSSVTLVEQSGLIEYHSDI